MRNFAKSLLPDDLYEKAKAFYKEHVTNYQRDIYSEFGEDFIAAVLLGFKREGLYVDIGAFRPKELSVTYYFYKKLGWDGLTIEPNPAVQEDFKEQRPRDIFVNCGVAKEESTLTYYEFEDALLNSFSEESYESFKSQFIRSREIKVQPLEKILDKYGEEGRKIDLMNIDVEGLDLDVLNSNNWDKYSPEVIIIEDHKFDPEEPLKSEIVQFLKGKGYKLKANALISLVFKKES
ncbi:MAG: FkbM family methyltransferase [Bdellovibrionota bacterium]|jgi:FkbM family methyltransferase|nr:FkbM family methyltransferase [Bdellovibrionota bacterium]